MCATRGTPSRWPKHSVSYQTVEFLNASNRAVVGTAVANPVAMCCVPVFAWEAYEKGSEVHLQADPTKLELLHQSFKVKKEDFKEKQKGTILDRVSPPLLLSISCSLKH